MLNHVCQFSRLHNCFLLLEASANCLKFELDNSVVNPVEGRLKIGCWEIMKVKHKRLSCSAGKCAVSTPSQPPF